MSGNNVTVKMKGDKSDLDKALKESESSVNKWSGAVKGAVAGIVAALAVRQVISFGSSMLELYTKQAAAETKLASVIRATGGAAGYTLDQFKAMASEMSVVSGVGDEVILNSMALVATFKNIRGDMFKEATQAALDLATVMDGDLKGATLQVSKALNDPTVGISALSDAGVSFTATQKEMIRTLQASGDMMGAQRVILDELAGEFGGAAADKAAGFKGQITGLWNAMGDLGEVIGGMLVPVLQTIIPVASMVVDFFGKLAGSLDENEEATKAWSESWGQYFVDVVRDGMFVVADIFSFGEFLFNNFGNIIERQTYAWGLSFVSGFEDLKHWLTVAVPEYLTWFSDNFVNIMTDLERFNRTIYLNMFLNAKSFFEGILDYLSGGSGDFKFRALTEGFEATTKELPKIAERNMTFTEKQLKQNIAQMDNLIGADLDRVFSKNRKFMNDFFDEDSALNNPEQIDMTANFEPVEAEAKKAEDKVKKIKDETKLALDAQNKADAGPGNVGSISNLEGLSAGIQLAAMQAKAIEGAAAADMADRTFEFNGAKTTKEGQEMLAAAGDAGDKMMKAEETKQNMLGAVVTLLQQIKDQHPELVGALKTAGALT